MGWQDAPVVGDKPAVTGGWQSAPVVDVAPTAEPKKPHSYKDELAGYLESIKRGGSLAVKTLNDSVYGAATIPVDFAMGAKDLIAGTQTKSAGERYKEWSDETIAPAKNVSESLVSGLTAAAIPTKYLTLAKTLIGRMGQGAGMGMAYGLSQPGSGEDRLASGAAGAAVGGSVPALASALASGGKAVRNTWDSVRRSDAGIKRLIGNHYDRILSEDAKAAVIPALRNAKDIIPGGGVTAAEAVSHVPEGAAIRGQQKITAATPGKPVEQFNTLMQGSKPAAITAAEAEREAITAPMRDAAFAAINRPVNNRRILARIDSLRKDPNNARSDVTSALSSWYDDLKGVRDPKALYSIRKEISDALRGKYFDSPNSGKRYTGKELRQIQGFIDDEIKTAGAGKAWDDYLAEFSKRSKDIEAFKARSEEMYKPAQSVNLAGSGNVAEESGIRAPPFIDRNVTIANWLGKMLRGKTEPNIDAEMARQFLNPTALADQLDKQPAMSKALSDFLKKKGIIVPAAIAAQELQ